MLAKVLSEVPAICVLPVSVLQWELQLEGQAG